MQWDGNGNRGDERGKGSGDGGGSGVKGVAGMEVENIWWL